MSTDGATDYERTLTHFRGLGLEPFEYRDGEGLRLVLGRDLYQHFPGQPPVQPRVDGYGGFFCEFDFTFDGQFREVGVWE